ncbi:MAG: single-stranded DNA-binding protein [Gemmatimonadaceae bacterium]|nr:single-stranded DNA-binding protein [Gloeobacterales cyanobacterium ES-bin-141]
MNAIALMGTLQSDPELRFTPDGLARASVLLSFPAAKAEEADYQIRVVAFGNLAEEVHKAFHHGDSVVVEGRLQADSRSKPDGTKEKYNELIARRLYAVGSVRAGAEETAPSPAVAAAKPKERVLAPAQTRVDETDMDEIPF